MDQTVKSKNWESKLSIRTTYSSAALCIIQILFNLRADSVTDRASLYKHGSQYVREHFVPVSVQSGSFTFRWWWCTDASSPLNVQIRQTFLTSNFDVVQHPCVCSAKHIVTRLLVITDNSVIQNLDKNDSTDFNYCWCKRSRTFTYRSRVQQTSGQLTMDQLM